MKRGRKTGSRNANVFPSSDTKLCTNCKKTKPIDEFYTRPPDDRGVVIYSPDCKACNKRTVVRKSWKRKLDKEGELPLVDRIKDLKELLHEAETILARFRNGEDVVYWSK